MVVCAVHIVDSDYNRGAWGHACGEWTGCAWKKEEGYLGGFQLVLLNDVVLHAAMWRRIQAIVMISDASMLELAARLEKGYPQADNDVEPLHHILYHP